MSLGCALGLHGGRRELTSISCPLTSILRYYTSVHTYRGAVVMHTLNPPALGRKKRAHLCKFKHTRTGIFFSRLFGNHQYF